MATRQVLLGATSVLAVLLLLASATAFSIALDAPANGANISKITPINLTLSGGEAFFANYSIDSGATNTSLVSPWDITGTWVLGNLNVIIYTGNATANYQNNYQFAVVNSAPVITNVTPTANTGYAGIANLYATISDADGSSDIVDAKFYVSNVTASIWTLLGSITAQTNSVFTYDWNISAFAEGTYKIKVIANDSNSLPEEISVGNLTVNNNNQNPLVTITSLNSGESIDSSAEVTWTATDADGEDLNGKINLYYSANAGDSWTLITGNQTNDGAYTWSTTALAEDNDYLINITVTDGFDGYASDVTDDTFTVAHSGSSGSDSGSTGEVSAGSPTLPAANTFDISQTYPSITAGTATELSINDEELALKKLTFTTVIEAINARVQIRDLSELPTSISVYPPDVYQLFEVETTNLNGLSIATFEFEVPKSWLTENNAAKEDIIIKHYTTGWTNLPTTFVSESGDNYKYTATTPSFSVFAIALKQDVGGIAETTQLETSGATALSGAAAGTLSLGNLNLPDISALPGGWFTLVGIIIAITLASLFIAGRQGLISLPSLDVSEHINRFKTKQKNARHAPVRKMQFNAPKIKWLELELPNVGLGKKEKKLEFGKNSWNKYKEQK